MDPISFSMLMAILLGTLMTKETTAQEGRRGFAVPGSRKGGVRREKNSADRAAPTHRHIKGGFQTFRLARLSADAPNDQFQVQHRRVTRRVEYRAWSIWDTHLPVFHAGATALFWGRWQRGRNVTGKPRILSRR
jgi:hypothetical protein